MVKNPKKDRGSPQSFTIRVLPDRRQPIPTLDHQHNKKSPIPGRLVRLPYEHDFFDYFLCHKASPPSLFVISYCILFSPTSKIDKFVIILSGKGGLSDGD